MRKVKYSVLFEKQLKKLNVKELQNVINKIYELSNSENLDHYKNLRYDLKKYKRVHVNNSYIILFFGDDEIIYFVDYEHHDKIYKKKYEQTNKLFLFFYFFR